MDETHFYNAIAIALESNYREMASLRQTHGDWRSAYVSLAREISIPDPVQAWKMMMERDIHITLLEDPRYPKSLAEISHPPLALYTHGSLKEGALIPFGIVGTRRATPEAKSIARRFSGALTQANFAIVSGLAFGVDCAAHEGCLEANGATIAVLANGLDSIYPSTNAPLADRIIKNGGMVVSEYPPGSPPLPYRFLERNRIVSGLSKGILVIESPLKSGCLTTARFAFEQNRDVFVVPGPITHQNFFGSHALIRQGAELVTSPDDILESYNITKAKLENNDFEGAAPEEKLILQALRTSQTPLDVDKIISLTRLEPRVANQALTYLLLKDFIKETGGGYIMNI